MDDDVTPLRAVRPAAATMQCRWLVTLSTGHLVEGSWEDSPYGSLDEQVDALSDAMVEKQDGMLTIGHDDDALTLIPFRHVAAIRVEVR